MSLIISYGFGHLMQRLVVYMLSAAITLLALGCSGHEVYSSANWAAPPLKIIDIEYEAVFNPIVSPSALPYVGARVGMAQFVRESSLQFIYVFVEQMKKHHVKVVANQPDAPVLHVYFEQGVIRENQPGVYHSDLQMVGKLTTDSATPVWIFKTWVEPGDMTRSEFTKLVERMVDVMTHDGVIPETKAS